MNQNINVDLIPKFAVYGNLYFSQYDVGREAIINLVNGSTEYEIPSGATVTLVATKPSGLGFTQNCTFEGNQITVVCTAAMTDEAGKFPCELRIVQGSTILGTANFTFNVERSPHPEGTTDGTADSVISQITVAFESAMTQIENSGGLTNDIKEALLNCFQKVAWIDQNGQDYYDALEEALYTVEVTGITLNSNSLLFNELNQTSQLTATLIPSTATNPISWSSSDTSVCTVVNGLVTSVGYGSATITASAGSVSATCSVSIVETTVVSLNAVLSGGTFYVGDPIDNIKPYLTVTANWSDSTSSTVPSGSYTLSGSLSNVGENTITVSYGGQSTTVTVNAISVELVSISAVYTQSGTVYDNQTLDSLKADLVVTASWDDSSTTTLSANDYSLSGTLAVGTSTITVSYEGKTDTFNVTVTEAPRAWTTGTPLTLGTVESGDINLNTGVDTVNANKVRTGLLDIEGACLILGRVVATKVGTQPQFYFYDADGDFISSYSFTSANNKMQLAPVPDDTKYVRITTPTANMGEEAGTPWEIVPFATPTVSFAPSTEVTSETVVAGSYQNGEFVSGGSTRVSQFIPIYGATSLSVTNNSYINMILFDKDQNFMLAVNSVGTPWTSTSIPWGKVAYIRIQGFPGALPYTVTIE